MDQHGPPTNQQMNRFQKHVLQSNYQLVSSLSMSPNKCQVKTC